MRSLVLLFLFAASSLSAAPSLFAAQRLEVPRGKTTPKIDGTVGATEWKSAVRVRIDDNTHALLQHNGTYLFIALVAHTGGSASLCTTNGADVLILHASAALGSAAFAKQGDKWTMTRGFTWSNRDTSETPEAMAARKTFLDAQKWFANTTPYFSTEREYQIRVTGRTEIPLVLSFLSFKSQNDSHLHYWPSRLEDSCADRDLAGGWEDGVYSFAPETWGIAVLR